MVRPLTAREKEISLLKNSGMNSRLIASCLGISSHTVKSHLAKIRLKEKILERNSSQTR